MDEDYPDLKPDFVKLESELILDNDTDTNFIAFYPEASHHVQNATFVESNQISPERIYLNLAYGLPPKPEPASSMGQDVMNMAVKIKEEITEDGTPFADVSHLSSLSYLYDQSSGEAASNNHTPYVQNYMTQKQVETPAERIVLAPLSQNLNNLQTIATGVNGNFLAPPTQNYNDLQKEEIYSNRFFSAPPVRKQNHQQRVRTSGNSSVHIRTEPVNFMEYSQEVDSIIEFEDVPIIKVEVAPEINQLTNNVEVFGDEPNLGLSRNDLMICDVTVDQNAISTEVLSEAAKDLSNVEEVMFCQSSESSKPKKNWYAKETYCPYCQTLIKYHFPRHLTTHHRDEEEVIQIKELQLRCVRYMEIIKGFNKLKKEGMFGKLSKGKKKKKENEFKEAKERWNELNKQVRGKTDKLRCEGGYQYNVAQPRGGKLLVKKNPNHDNYTPTVLTHAICAQCFKTVIRANLCDHIKICKKNPCNNNNMETCDEDEEEIKASCRVRALKTSAQLLLFRSPDEKGVIYKIFEKDILDRMLNDMPSLIARTDPLLMEVGVRLFTNHRDKKHHSKIKSTLRDLARLFLLLDEEHEDISCFEDCINPKKFQSLLGAVQKLADYNIATGHIGVASISGRFQGSLKLCADAVWARTILDENINPAVKEHIRIEISEFQHLMAFLWKFDVTNCEKVRKKKHALKQDLIPLDEDIQTLSEMLAALYPSLISSLKQKPNQKTFQKLCKLIIADILVFNRRRPGEVCGATLQQYSLKTRDDDYTSTEEVLSLEEKEASQNLHVFFVPGKNNKQVPILLTELMEEGIQCLLAARNTLRVPSSEKDLLFLKLTKKLEWVAYDGSMELSEFVQNCPLKKPDHVTCTGLRHHIATDTQLHKHSSNYQTNLADFLGHTLNVHLRNYMLPVSIIFRAQIGARLMKFRKKGGTNKENVDEPGLKAANEGLTPHPQEETLIYSPTQEASFTSAAAEEINKSNNSNDVATYSQDAESKDEFVLKQPQKRTCQTVESDEEAPKAKKVRWTEQQKAIVSAYFEGNFKEKVAPSRKQIRVMYDEQKVLQERRFNSVYIYIHNQIKNGKK